MKLCVIGSCGKKKRTHSSQAPQCKDLEDKESMELWREKLSGLTVKARDMYLGNQSKELVRGVDLLRRIDDVEVDLFIVSAGFGFLQEDTHVPPYECSFSGMGKAAIRERARMLSIPQHSRQVLGGGYDWYYLALGKKYLIALGEDWQRIVSATTVCFDKSVEGDVIVNIPSGNKTVKQFSRSGHKVHGAAGFKGDLLRILAHHALRKDIPYKEVLRWTDSSYIRGLIYDLGELS